GRRLIGVVVALLTTFSSLFPSEARDLTDVLQQGLTLNFSTFRLETSEFAQQIAPAFAGAISQAVTQQVPLTSAGPAYIYHSNPDFDTFERVTGVPGPLFSERALTLGKGQINFSVGYSYINFSTLNGTELDNIANSALLLDPSTKEAVPVVGLHGGGVQFVA